MDQRIRVHRNLHAARAGAPQWVITDGRGRVVERVPYLALADVETMVQPAGVRRCHETGVRAVCARFKGRPAALWELPDAGLEWWRTQFDPRRDEAFMAVIESPFGPEALSLKWNHARYALLAPSGSCTVFDPEWREQA